MTLEGRIVGVGMSKSLNVEYTFQPERISGIQEVGDVDREFILEREKGEKKRYPLVKLAFPLEVGDTQNKCGILGGISNVLSIGYLLMERKETILIQCELKKESSVFIGTVDSFCIGEETGMKDSQSECAIPAAPATPADSATDKEEANGGQK